MKPSTNKGQNGNELPKEGQGKGGNLSLRLFARRFTRCTLGYSKKLDNLKYAVALFVWYFNFARKNGAHGWTPAFAAGVGPKEPMTISELLKSAN